MYHGKPPGLLPFRALIGVPGLGGQYDAVRLEYWSRSGSEVADAEAFSRSHGLGEVVETVGPLRQEVRREPGEDSAKRRREDGPGELRDDRPKDIPAI